MLAVLLCQVTTLDQPPAIWFERHGRDVRESVSGLKGLMQGADGDTPSRGWIGRCPSERSTGRPERNICHPERGEHAPSLRSE
jgi:hypothetical protein